MTDPHPAPDEKIAESDRPADGTEPADTDGAAEPADAAQAAEPDKAAEPAEAAQPDEATGSAEPAEPAEPPQPEAPTEPTEPALSTEPDEPPEPAEPAQPAPSAETTPPAEPVTPATPAETASTAEPADPAAAATPAAPATVAEPTAVASPIADPATGAQLAPADPTPVVGISPVPTAPADTTGIPGVAPTAAPPPAAPTVQPGAIAVPPGPVGPTVGDQAAELTQKTIATLTTTTRTFLAGLDPTGIRPTLIVAGILLALVLGTQLLNGILPAPGPRVGPNVGPNVGPVTAGSRVEVTGNVSFLIVGGWQPGTRFTDDLPGVLLQKGNVFMEMRATRASFGGTLTDFMSRLVGIIGGQLSGFQSTPAQTVALGNGLNGIRVDYAGTNRNGAVEEGEITVFLSANGTGILAHAFGQQGSVQPLLGEVRTMISTLEVR